MTTPTRGGDPGPRMDREAGIEAPLSPVLAGGRGLHQQAGLLVVAAVAMAVVAAGIGLGGRGTEPGSSAASAATRPPASAPSGTAAASGAGPGTGPAPGATPEVTPAVACAPFAPDAPSPRLLLDVGDGQPVVGLDAPASFGDVVQHATLVRGSFPDPLIVRVEGDVCATSWQIRFLSPVDGSEMNQVSQENPGENPFRVSQNSIDVLNAVFGQTIVWANVSFGRTRSAEAAWELTLTGPPAPVAKVFSPRGSSVTARAGCGVGWSLANGQNAFERCDTYRVPDDVQLLTILAGEAVGLDVPGWQITSWWVSCGDRSPVDGTYQDDPAQCQLGGQGNGVDPVGPVRFIPFPDRHVVSVWINAIRNGNNVGAQYFVEVEAKP